MRSRFTTESCWATSSRWPRPVVWRWTIAARIPIAVWSPAPAIRFQIERDALLVRVQQQEEPGVLAALVGERRAPLLTRRRLDLDDVGAEPPQHLGGAWARLVLGQIEDADPLESFRHQVLRQPRSATALPGRVARGA